MPDNVETIDQQTFAECFSLKNITLSNKLTNISARMFESTALESITIPNLVQTIGEEAFKNCQLLHTVTLGDSVTSIEFNAFGDTILTSLYMSPTVASRLNISFTACITHHHHAKAVIAKVIQIPIMM